MLKFRTRKENDVAVITLEGRIDGGADSPQIQEAVKDVLDGGHRKILLDLDGVEWVNSLGVGYLVAALVSVRNLGGVMKLRGTHGRTVTVLRTTGLIPNIIPLYESEEEALASFH